MKQGQGIIESVFAVGILLTLLTGAILLVTFGVSNRNRSFDRRRATELATIVTEELVGFSQNDPINFWLLNSQVGKTKAEFAGYTYSVNFTNISGDANYPSCGVGVTNCAEAVIGIGWSGKEAETLYFNRFFNKH